MTRKIRSASSPKVKAYAAAVNRLAAVVESLSPLAWLRRRREKKERLILDILERHGEEGCYGLDLVMESHGKLSRGIVYVYLDRLRDRGLVTAYHDGGGRLRFVARSLEPYWP